MIWALFIAAYVLVVACLFTGACRREDALARADEA
ncbi:hypothetical protein CGUA_02745 [Corynebacterium guangdongense]|uniref:Uncharacterized protein n=1 Tax=Corynebacterium guangdongense TaxID=1783348 RepID=A0ABU1ZUG2_9CORY|nr:hypothetical protein [Corynebacterium guangdongense]WJZ17145.1 hypothetical protein CGUA_02745 [Corynebacterium guangdongense]